MKVCRQFIEGQATQSPTIAPTTMEILQQRPVSSRNRSKMFSKISGLESTSTLGKSAASSSAIAARCKLAAVSQEPRSGPAILTHSSWFVGEAPGADEDTRGEPVRRPRRPVAGPISIERASASSAATFISAT